MCWTSGGSSWGFFSIGGSSVWADHRTSVTRQGVSCPRGRWRSCRPGRGRTRPSRRRLRGSTASGRAAVAPAPVAGLLSWSNVRSGHGSCSSLFTPPHSMTGSTMTGTGRSRRPRRLLGWKKKGGDSRFPRVINLFVVPYQALKTKQGSGDPVPILGFASFFVMEWGGVNNNDDDPCPDRTFDHDNNPATAQVPLNPSRSGRSGHLRREGRVRARARSTRPPSASRAS